jgi:hypothetical protein
MLTPYYVILINPRRCNTNPILAFKLEWIEYRVFLIGYQFLMLNFTLVKNEHDVGTLLNIIIRYGKSLPTLLFTLVFTFTFNCFLPGTFFARYFGFYMAGERITNVSSQYGTVNVTGK